MNNFQKFENAVSLSWTGYLEKDGIFDGLYEILTVKKGVDNIINSIKKIYAPTINFIFATTDNHIGYYA